MKKLILKFVFTITAGLFALPLSLAQKTPEKPLLVLDAGHTPQQGGAISVRGIYEVEYNDRFVAELKPKLEKIGWKIVLTRNSDEFIELKERAAKANGLNADLFLSIHHDSAQLQFLEKIKFKEKDVYRTIIPIRGYSLFVSQENPEFEKSQCFAKLLSQNILPLGRTPNLNHAEKIKGENRILLDVELGIYRYDGLAVLRLSKMPAVLLEVGVIPDEHDEAWINNDKKRKDIENAIVDAVKKYKKNCE